VKWEGQGEREEGIKWKRRKRTKGKPIETLAQRAFISQPRASPWELEHGNVEHGVTPGKIIKSTNGIYKQDRT